MALKDWGFSNKSSAPPWPKKEDGQPVSPEYLTNLNATEMEGQIVISLLESNGIPVVIQRPNNGDFGQIILGFSGTGIDIYVPETMLEDAQALISIEHEEEEEDV